MTFAERLARWNQWYDQAPETWRFNIVLWPLLAVGAINMALTIAVGFPFALLVVLGILLVACIRVPYSLGWVKVEQAGATSRFEIEALPWVYSINKWYDGLPEFRRPVVILGVLIVVGAINMALTINHGFSFGLLFLLAMLAMILIRGPYAAGWLIPPRGYQGQLGMSNSPGQLTQASPRPLPVAHQTPPHSGSDGQFG
jgi:hypothetical protein